MAGLRVRSLSKGYGRVPALQDVTLDVAPGEIVALVGENGAGKTTLVRCLTGELDPDAGSITLGERERLAVVWQDLGLCDDLDVVSNVFLGHELGGWWLSDTRMREATQGALDRLHAEVPDLYASVASLSRGQRQLIALARALITDAELLVLDEPTAALGVRQREYVAHVLRELRARGRGVLLISHDLDEVFALADRIVVLRRGRVVGTVTPLEAHPDDVTALMSGMESEPMAKRQLRRLQSLVEQLSSAAPAASLPLVVSATAAALDQEMLCLHVLADGPGGPALRRSAAVGLPPSLLVATETLPVGSGGGVVGRAASSGKMMQAEDLRDVADVDPVAEQALEAGLRSAWSAPIVGTDGVLGTISGFATTTGRLARDREELLSLYAGHSATAIQREQLFAEVSRRNDVLEALRTLLESLAGPARVQGGLSVALLALCRGLSAYSVGVLRPPALGTTDATDAGDDETPRWVCVTLDGTEDERLRAVVDAATPPIDAARRAGPGIAVAGLHLPDADGVLAARWLTDDAPAVEALELLDDARRSLALALERESIERARQEAATARRSQSLQRNLLQQLSHELRTPLTAIQGYASTLQQPDLAWDAGSTDRFLTAIATESARMERLVGDLLDSSAIESGSLRLRRDWTDLGLVLEAARACVTQRDRVALHLPAALEPVWADHDRLEQVFVNLVENALRHGAAEGTVDVTVRPAAPGVVEVLVSNDGPRIAAEQSTLIFQPRVRGDGSGAGLGLAIARGIAEAHGGACELLEDTRTTFRVALPVEPPEDPANHDDTAWGLVEEEPAW